MKKVYLITLVLIALVISKSFAQTQTQDLNMGLYQIQFLSANQGSNRIQSYGGSYPGTWLFKSRFDNIVLDAGENENNRFQILFKTGNIERARINTNGYFGVGITSPQEIFHIKEDGATIKLSSSTYYGGSGQHLDQVISSIKFNNYNAGNTNLDYSSEIRGVITNGWANSMGLAFMSQGNEVMRIKSNGNVGIGTTQPDTKLAVNGTIHTKEVKVDLNGWSDFVFDNDYNLRTLDEVEQHINENGHLPEIPSEAEVTENGINLGEMNAKLLQKIEELTLYMIDMNKRMTEVEKENTELKKAVSALKND